MMSSSVQTEEGMVLSNGQKSRKSRGKITWDEEVIASHDKDRGTRMKVDEPETPYMYPEPEDMIDEEVKAPPQTLANNWDEIAEKLKQAAQAQKEKEPEARLEWVEKMEQHEEKARAFADKRRQHYNEFERLKQWREDKQAQVDDELL